MSKPARAGVSQVIATVSADGAFDTSACHEAIAARDACAINPARSTAKAWPGSTRGVAARNEIVRSGGRLGRAIWQRWSGYHQRSLVETKMHCFKLLGQQISARDFDRQAAEIQIRAAILNRFTALGRPQTQRIV